jgi:glutathione S-transferase
MKYKLIGSKTCPFVHRCIMVFLFKKIDYQIEFVDLTQKPIWFKQLSPTGKVPILQVNDKILFESTVINEYLDETVTPSLHPIDPIERAINRGWVEFSSSLVSTYYALLTTDEENKFSLLFKQLDASLLIVETMEKQFPYFNGNNISLVDIAFASFFIRLNAIEKNYPLNLLSNKPNTKEWAKNLLTNNIINKSIPDDYESLLLKNLKNSNGIILNGLSILPNE